MSNINIKWGCIQPLTGGMYLGAEKAIGHKAEWIISYPGLTDYVKDKKTNNIVDAGNERNIFNYLQKHDRLPEWYLMNRTMTQCDEDFNPVYTPHPEANMNATQNPNLKVDIVVAVPVCAGLSMASIASQDRKDECNCQMIWITKFTLKTIRPKVYIFENAPTLMSDRGDDVRDQLETIALEAGYSVVYYKTDTKYHHNCQKRPRTFIMFFKHKDGKPFIPELNYEHDNMSVSDFFNELEHDPMRLEDDPMNVTTINDVWTEPVINYSVHRFGDNWREVNKGDMLDFIIYNKEEREPFMTWLKENFDERIVKIYERHFSHCDYKMSIEKGWWGRAAKYFDGCLPACMYKNIPITVHHVENRLYTIREWLWAMGHPADFIMHGVVPFYTDRIGQNVPVNTACWVTKEGIRIIENWDNEATVSETQNVGYYDNTKMKRIWPTRDITSEPTENPQTEIDFE